MVRSWAGLLPLARWSFGQKLIFKRNFRSASRSGSPSVDGVFAALPEVAEGRGCPACQPQGPVTEEPRARGGGAAAVGQPCGPPETLVALLVAAAVGQGCGHRRVASPHCWLSVDGCVSVWPGNTAAVLSRPWHPVTISSPSRRVSPRIAPCSQLRFSLNVRMAHCAESSQRSDPHRQQNGGREPHDGIS